MARNLIVNGGMARKAAAFAFTTTLLFVFKVQAFQFNVISIPAQKVELVEHSAESPLIKVHTKYGVCNLRNGEVGEARKAAVAVLSSPKDHSLIALQILVVEFQAAKQPCHLYFLRLRGSSVPKDETYYRLLGVQAIPGIGRSSYTVDYSKYGKTLLSQLGTMTNLFLNKQALGFQIPVVLEPLK